MIPLQIYMFQTFNGRAQHELESGSSVSHFVRGLRRGLRLGQNEGRHQIRVHAGMPTEHDETRLHVAGFRHHSIRRGDVGRRQIRRRVFGPEIRTLKKNNCLKFV